MDKNGKNCLVKYSSVQDNGVSGKPINHAKPALCQTHMPWRFIGGVETYLYAI